MDGLESMIGELLKDPKNVEMLKGLAAELQGAAEGGAVPSEPPSTPMPDLSGPGDIASALSGVYPAV